MPILPIRTVVIRFTLPAILVCALSSSAFAQLAAGDDPPDELGRTRQGKQIKISDHRGKVVAVSFWASWCGPCQLELPMLEKLQRAVGPERLAVLAVNIEDKEKFREVTRPMFDWQSTIVSDPYKDAFTKYQGSGIPYLLVISRDGKVRSVFRGYSEESVRKVVSAVADTINE